MHIYFKNLYHSEKQSFRYSLRKEKAIINTKGYYEFNLIVIMDKEEKEIRKYESALSLLFYEGEIAWQLNVVFIAINVGVASLISDPLKGGFLKFNAFLLAYAIIGLIINFLWLGTFERNNRYYGLRVAQARESEPEEWKFLKDRGYRFSTGEKIIIGGEGIKKKHQKHKLSIFARLVSNKWAIKGVIILMITVYCLLLFLCLRTFQICF